MGDGCEIPDDSPTNQKMSLLDNKQDKNLNEESIFEDLEQKNEADHVYDSKEQQISDSEGVDSALGQVNEIEGKVEFEIKSSAEPKGHEETEGTFSEMEGESSLQTVQSGLTATSDSQPQQSLDLNPVGNRRKLGSSRRKKGRQHDKDTVAELPHETTGEVAGNTPENKYLETEMSFPLEPVVQEQTEETMLKGMEIFDTAPAEYVANQIKEDSLVGIFELTGSNLHASLTKDQQTIDQSNVGEMPEEEFPNVCTITEKDSKENENDTVLFRHDENVQTDYLMSESQETSEDNESSITSEITTEKQDLREITEPDCNVAQEAFVLSKEESTAIEETNEWFNVSEVKGGHQSEDDVNTLHEQEVKPTETQEMPQIDFSSDYAIHAVTEKFEIIPGNSMDPTEIREMTQWEMVVKIPDDSPTNQKMSLLDNKQDKNLNEESIFEDLEQKNEADHVYDSKEQQISDSEGVDSALGQVNEIEGKVEFEIKSSAEPKGHEETEGLFSEMEGESSLQTVQSGLTATSDSQPQQSLDLNPIGNRRKLGSSRRKKGRQHDKDTVAELPHETTGEVAGNTPENKYLETEMSFPLEPVLQEQTEETMLKGMEIFDTAPAEYVANQIKEDSLVGIFELTGSNLHASLTKDQQTIDQSNVGEMPEEEFPNVCTITEKDSKENENDTVLFRHDENVQTDNLMSESQETSEDNESSITSEITTEKQDLREITEPDCNVAQEAFVLSKEESTAIEETNEWFNVSEVKGGHQSEDDVNTLHEQEFKPTETQEMPQIDFSSDYAIHAVTEKSEIIPGNSMDPTEIREMTQWEMVVRRPDDSPTNQKMSLIDNKQDKNLNEESIFEDLEQKNEADHVYDSKEQQISDSEGVDSALGQVNEIEGKVEFDIKSSAEPKGHEETEGLFSEMEGESSLQTVLSGLTATSDSQPQQSLDLNPIGNRRKLGSSRRKKGRQHDRDTVAELPHETTGEVLLMSESQVTEEPQISNIASVDSALGEVNEIEGQVEYGMMISAEPKGHEEVKELFLPEMEESKSSLQTVQSEKSPPSDSLTPEEIESSITSEITTQKQDLREHTEPECSVVPAVFASSEEKESTNGEQKEQIDNSSIKVDTSSFQTQQSDIKALIDSPSLDISQSTNPTGNRRKFGSSRRNKGPLHIKDTTKMSLLTETIKQEELKKKSDLDLSSNVNDAVNTLEEGIILSHNEKDNSAIMKTDINLSLSNDDFVKSNKDVDEEKNKQKETENVSQLAGCDTVKMDWTEPPEVSLWKDESYIQSSSYHGDNVPSRPLAFDVLEQEETFQVQSSEALSCDKDMNVKQTNDTSPTVADVTAKDFNPGMESSMYINVSTQDADGEQSEDPLKTEHKTQEISVSEKMTKNETDTLAPFHIGLEENFRAEPAVDVFAGIEMSSHQKVKKSDSDHSEDVQGRSKQKRRKMGSTRRIQLNRKPEEKSDETEESDFKTEAVMRNLCKIEGLEELPMIMTAEVSQSENAKSSQSPMNKEEEVNETSTVHNTRQNIPSSDLESIQVNVLSDIDNSKALLSEQFSSCNEEFGHPAKFVHVADERDRHLPQVDDFTTTERQIHNPLLSENTEENGNPGITGESLVSFCETTQSMQNDEERQKSESIIQDQTLKSEEAPVVANWEILTSVVREGAEDEHIGARHSKQQLDNPTEVEMNNPSPNRRRKMGSTRRNLGSRNKREDLHQKQDLDNEATETATNVGDVKSEHFQYITEDELLLNLKHKDTGSEQRKGDVSETVEYSQTVDSHLQLHQTFEGNPVPQGQHIETEHEHTPNSSPAVLSTSPKEDLTSETASGGRRRKMGSSRKAHGLKKYENQTASTDKIQDTQHESDVRSNTDESAIKTPEELREESLSLDQMSEADESEKKPSYISTLKEGNAPRPVSHLMEDRHTDRAQGYKVGWMLLLCVQL
ncbi:uncharacterized protein rab44 isoform X2 [Eleginops maclovinus]|uniref:uncharacterized protein rab44 isoform X2 n=1 Tax=Eleginops maclovinus TaxID=56733 RepID=UPI003080E1CA